MSPPTADRDPLWWDPFALDSEPRFYRASFTDL
jgi:hypothetical protein